MLDTTLDFAIYSIKAVAHMADITEPTLRAWEKRYSILSPGRTESGHRRYTKRDIYRVMWLKQRLEEGMSISQASTMLQTQPDIAQQELARYEKNGRASWGGIIKHDQASDAFNRQRQASAGANQVRSPAALTEQLLQAFLEYDEATAERLLIEATSLYPAEIVCVDIIQNLLVEIGERWMRGEITVAVEHFTTTLCRSRLNAMIEGLPLVKSGPLVLTACAPQEYHEVGVIITTYFLKRHGWRAIYIGQNVPAVDLEKDLQKLQPALLVFSAGRNETAQLLARQILPVVENVRDNFQPDLIFAYGGQAFVHNPELHDLFKGHTYFGDNARHSVELIENLLSPR